MSILTDPELQVQIDRLQARSRGQEDDINSYFRQRVEAGNLSWDGLDEDAHTFFSDKLVALDPAKAEFCHLLCRAMRARRVVEVGTSYGVSTLYLADAVRANGGGKVVATEHEPEKAAEARANFLAAGLEPFIELREGDLRDTLKVLEGPIDFVLMDIWTEMVRPAMSLITPHLRPGAAVVCDNTSQFSEAYRDYFDFIGRGGFVTRTLPFDGGLELTIRT
ncbi:MAG: O-methyltransferase [Pseudomonadales bacterium]